MAHHVLANLITLPAIVLVASSMESNWHERFGPFGLFCSADVDKAMAHANGSKSDES